MDMSASTSTSTSTSTHMNGSTSPPMNMAPVADRTLQWLSDVLHQYRHPQRTYSDTARALSAFPSLLPATDVYTRHDGTSALLLRLAGTLPAAFRGTTYRFPLTVWIPHAYPDDAPFAYVTPGKDMVVRPGQHVGVDGRIYHPYLSAWSSMCDRASTAEFLHRLSHVFSREPPVISRAQHHQQHQQRPPAPPHQPPGPGPAPPQLPPKQPAHAPHPSDSASVATPPPPPLPPKSGEEYAEPGRGGARHGPPLPPLPHQAAHQPRSSSLSQNTHRPAPRTPSHNVSASSPVHLHDRPPGPPLPPSAQAQGSSYHHQHPANQNRSPLSPVPPQNGVSELPGDRYMQPAPYSPHQQPPPFRQADSQIAPQQHAQRQWEPAPTTHQPRPKQPAPDLLTDPFDVAILAPGPSTLPAPPIPPNPEKEHLLQAISAALVQQAQQKVSQNLDAVAPLQAQEYALRMAQERLDGEIRQLEQLEQAVSVNESILHRSIQDCDRTIATARSKKQPPIDEVLIAPTMVANQLWTLCAEEAACREAMSLLQKAVDRGRVGGDVFVRQTRNLARDCFLHMAQARKCAAGMGLELRHTPT